MKKFIFSVLLALSLISGFSLVAQSLNPEVLPPAINAAKRVHFVSLDGAFTAPNTNWLPCLKTLSGGDQVTEPVTIGGHTGVEVKGVKFNNADSEYPLWASQHYIDVLMQVYGDEAFVDAKGQPRYFNFLTGTLPEPIAVDAGTLPLSIMNHQWNWVLFRVPNGLRHMDGGRLVGTIHPKAKLDENIARVSQLSGQNGGTMRMDGLHGLKVRFVAFGEKGAFGEPDAVNVFAK